MTATTIPADGSCDSTSTPSSTDSVSHLSLQRNASVSAREPSFTVMLLPQAVASDAAAVEQGTSRTSSQFSSELGSSTVKQVPEVDFLQSSSDDTEILSLAEHFLDGDVLQDHSVQWVS